MPSRRSARSPRCPWPSVIGGLAIVAAACGPAIERSSIPMAPGCAIAVTLSEQPARMVVDTGSEGTLVATATAERLGLVCRTGELLLTDSSGVERTMALVDLPELRIGATRFSGEAMTGPIHPSLHDGIVGMQHLECAAWLFDFRDQVLHCSAPADAESMVGSHGYRVVARLSLGEQKRRPMVAVRVEDSEDVVLLLDTGAESSSLPMGVVRRLGLPAGEELARQRAAEQQRNLQSQLDAQGITAKITWNGDDGSSVGIHGQTVHRPLHHLRKLAIGGIVSTDLVVTARDGEGVLGRDVLRRFPWLLHGERSEMWILAKP